MRNSFTQKIVWLWNNIEKILVLVFFATFSLNVRKVFPMFSSYPGGELNEYLTPNLNWSDVLILSLIIIYIIKYIIRQYEKAAKSFIYKSNNNSILSSLADCITFLLHRITLSFKVMVSATRSETFFLFLFLIWSAISIFWAPLRLIAAYRLFIILLIVNFVAIIQNLVKKGHIKAEFIYLGLITGGILQSLIGISQFFLNRSLGLKIIGESILGPDLPGVAKIIVFGVKHIRAYGTFPHPNILAGFLVVQIILLVSLLAERLAHATSTEDKVSHETTLANIPSWLLIIVLLTNTGCFLFTFSRSAFLSLFLAGLALLFINLAHNRKKIWLILTIVIFTLLLYGFPYTSCYSNGSFLSTQSLKERSQHLDVSRETIAGHPLVGIGLGQFVFQEFVSHPNWPSWQYQPVHNIYLLIASELGIVGLILFLLFLLTFLINYCKVNNLFYLLTYEYFCIILFSFLLISFFDHYFWDIKLGIIIFAIPFALNIANNQEKRKEAE